MSGETEEMSLDKRLALVSFTKDADSFITVDTKLCQQCEKKPCLYICPAQVYTWQDQLNYNIEGCMETGACLIVCHKIGAKAITWKYPAGGKGVSFKQG
jgi:ferredoxin like protein